MGTDTSNIYFKKKHTKLVTDEQTNRQSNNRGGIHLNRIVLSTIFIQDGKFWSGGGVTSGIDLAFAFLNDQAGRAMAGLIQLTLEYFPSQVKKKRTM